MFLCNTTRQALHITILANCTHQAASFKFEVTYLEKKITSMTSAVKKYYLSNKLTLLQFFKLTFLLHRHGICSGPAVISSHNEALEVTTSQSSMKFSEDKSRHGAE